MHVRCFRNNIDTFRFSFYSLPALCSSVWIHGFLFYVRNERQYFCPYDDEHSGWEWHPEFVLKSMFNDRSIVTCFVSGHERQWLFDYACLSTDSVMFLRVEWVIVRCSSLWGRPTAVSECYFHMNILTKCSYSLRAFRQYAVPCLVIIKCVEWWLVKTFCEVSPPRYYQDFQMIRRRQSNYSCLWK